MVRDPDAPRGEWYHWIVVNMPPNMVTIAQNSIPGTQVTNSWGIEKYKGPKPPSGTHRYFFTVNIKFRIGLCSKHRLGLG